MDRLLIGGGMCFTFLAAQGYQVGGSLLEAGQIGACRAFLAARGADGTAKVALPSDGVVAAATADARADVVGAGAIPAGRKGLDIGPATVASFAAQLATAHRVLERADGRVRSGAVRRGHPGVAEAVAAVPGLSVVGGGDSAAAVRALGFEAGAFGHVSTGGGASLVFLQGRTLPGLAALDAAR